MKEIAVADEPLYDPAEHTDPDVVVRAEVFCECGGMHRQVDPVRMVLPMIATFRDKHAGKGHGPVGAHEANTEREARREAALRAAGRGPDYSPKKHTGLDVDSSAGAPWDWSKSTKKAGS